MSREDDLVTNIINAVERKDIFNLLAIFDGCRPGPMRKRLQQKTLSGASEIGSIPIVFSLLEQGTPYSILGERGFTMLLLIATSRQNRDLVQALLDYIADINENKNTRLYSALWS